MLAAIGTGVAAGVAVLVVAGAVIMVLARGPLRAAVGGLRGGQGTDQHTTAEETR